MVLALATACGGGDPSSPSLRATVVRPDPDTLRFEVPAAALRCSNGNAVLLQGADERGSGVLVRLRYRDSLVAGVFPLIALGDSIAPRGANVAVRYMKGDVAHGLALDSGAVDLTTTGDTLAARVRGSGLEASVRVAVDASYTPMPLSADTTPCRYLP
jgi:hypothetical protein